MMICHFHTKLACAPKTICEWFVMLNAEVFHMFVNHYQMVQAFYARSVATLWPLNITVVLLLSMLSLWIGKWDLMVILNVGIYY